MMCDHTEKRRWSLGVDVGSPKTSPAIITGSCRVTNLAGQRNKETVCIRVSEKTLASFSYFGVQDGETWAAEFGSWENFQWVWSQGQTGQRPPVWIVTKLYLYHSPF